MPGIEGGKDKDTPDIFGAVSAPLRLEILKLLHLQRSLSYSDIMNRLGLDTSRDAGKFAYHLRKLLKTGLLGVDKESKKYALTPLGHKLIGFSHEIDEHMMREEGKLLVRTSNLSMEEFDRDKIAQALSREAGIPLDQARRIAEETEERLLKLDTLYLTAPLIREFVNALLVEKGLQEYRKKHTRLGLPVYDVTSLFENAEAASKDVEGIQSLTGKTVMRDYLFLNVLPSRVTEAHFSGSLHVNKADSWITKPDEVQHDLTIFLKRGFKLDRANTMIMTYNPPQTFDGALKLTEALLHSSRTEVSGELALPHFNVFLAPYVRDLSLEDLRRALKKFIFSVNYMSRAGMGWPGVSLGLDLTIPGNINELEVRGEAVDDKCHYGDYLDDSVKTLIALLDVMFEDDAYGPVFTPRLSFNLTRESLTSKEFEDPLLKTHELGAKWGLPYFVNNSLNWQEDASYFTSGDRLDSDWTGDWELDTLRTGSLGTVVLNLPRLALESRRDDRGLKKGLSDYLKTALTALKRKHLSVEKRVKQGLLPILSQEIANESYLRMENSTLNISFTGLNEAVKLQTGKQIFEDRSAIDYAERIIGHIALQAKRLSWKSGLRVALTNSVNEEVSTRFAELDVKRYGWKNTFAQGSEASPYYTGLGAVPLEAEVPLGERLRIESCFHPLLRGGHLSFIELEEPERSPENLLKTSKRICKSGIGAFAYSRSFGYCLNCEKSFGGIKNKCPECKAVKNFVQYSRSPFNYMPLNHCPPSRRERIMRLKRYIL